MGRLASIGALGLSLGTAQALAQQPTPQPQRQQPHADARAKNVVVHLTKSANEDPHAAFMALTMANALQRAGGSVTLFLDLEGVRLADARSPGEFRMGNTSAAELYDSFTSTGGKVVLCSHCAQAAGLEASMLRRGATLLNDQTLVRTITSADQIVDY
ncbi:MAG: DsrE family protein [Minicystis sp.]